MMDTPQSRTIVLLCSVYGLIAVAGLYVAVFGQKVTPAPLAFIDNTGTRVEQIEQARRIMEQAQEQQPVYLILNMFYKGWLLESDYRSLSTYTQPLYEGDSFERRIASYNDTAEHVDEIYRDAVTALAFLSSGSLILVMVMLWIPSYLVAVLLAVYPVVVVFTCALLDVNYDPLEYCWVPFIALGGIIFVLQLIFSFRYGRPEHRTVEGLPGLMTYRRGLLMLNLGIFLLVGALLMATGSLSGTGRSARTLVGLALFGEGGIAFFGFLGGTVLTLSGAYYIRRRPSETSSWQSNGT